MTAIKDISPAEFTISYNGFQFGPLCRYTITAQPQYDPAGRTVAYVTYVLNVVSWQYAATEDASSTLEQTLRQQLMEARGQLVIQDIGWGDTDTFNTHSPIVWGPKPRSFSFQPLGGGVCWEVTWSCEFAVNECASRNIQAVGGSPLVLFNYSVDYATDELGFTSRTISGTLKIPQHGRTKQVNDTPEYYRDKIRIPVPAGYKSGGVRTQVNAAHDELHFSVVHKQLDHEPYPPGIAKCNITFSASGRATKGGGILPEWVFQIQGTLETVPGFPKSFAGLRFFQIAFARLKVLKKALATRRYSKGDNKGKTPALFIAAADMSHEPYMRSSSFRMVWAITGAVNGQMFNPGILYEQLPQELRDYTAWVTTPYNSASLQRLWTAGGQTNLTTLPGNIVDLCAPTYAGSILSTGGTYPLGAAEAETSPSELFNCQQIEKQNSWLAYEPVAQLMHDERVEINKRDIKADIARLKSALASSPEPFYLDTASVTKPYDYSPDTISQSGLPEQRLIFKGKAVRVHYPVAIPAIKSIEGVPLTMLKNLQESTPFAQLYGGCAMYSGRWIQVYRPEKYLSGKVLAMPHPHVVVEDEGAMS